MDPCQSTDCHTSPAARRLLVYIPNADPGNVTNIVTSTLQLPVANQTRIFDRSYLLASRGHVNATNDNLSGFDEHWGMCVACAAVERTRVRQGVRREAACEQCFARYCFTAGPSESGHLGSWRAAVNSLSNGHYHSQSDSIAA